MRTTFNYMKNIQHKFGLELKVINTILIVFPLLLGGAVYILLRPAEPLFFEWIKIIGLEDWLYLLRNNKFISSFTFPDWFIYSLPSGLWAFSYAFIIAGIWSDKNSILKYFWLATIPVLVFGFEFLQLSHLVKGTFSIPDLVFGFIGILSGTTITKLHHYEKNKR